MVVEQGGLVRLLLGLDDNKTPDYKLQPRVHETQLSALAGQ